MPEKHKSRPGSLVAGVSSGAGKMAYAPSPGSSESCSISIAKIQPRLREDLRPLRPSHVVRLAESILVAGLNCSISVDCVKRLVAGRHRLIAFQLIDGLRRCTTPEDRIAFFVKLTGCPEKVLAGPEENLIERIQMLQPERIDEFHPGATIPCIIKAFDSATNPELLDVSEVVENEHRLKHTKADVMRIVELFVERGYRTSVGRPKRGEKTLIPAVAEYFGESISTVKRILSNPKVSAPEDAVVSDITYLPALLKACEKAIPELEKSRSPKLKKAHEHAEALRSILAEHLG